MLTEITKTISSSVDVLEMMAILKEKSICSSENQDEECHGLSKVHNQKEYCEPCETKRMRKMDCLRKIKHRTIKKTEKNKKKMRNMRHTIERLDKNVNNAQCILFIL